MEKKILLMVYEKLVALISYGKRIIKKSYIFIVVSAILLKLP